MEMTKGREEVIRNRARGLDADERRIFLQEFTDEELTDELGRRMNIYRNTLNTIVTAVRKDAE